MTAKPIILTLVAILALVISVSAIDKNTNAWISTNVIYLGNHPEWNPPRGHMGTLDSTPLCARAVFPDSACRVGRSFHNER